jgi:hypothetical protein
MRMNSNALMKLKMKMKKLMRPINLIEMKTTQAKYLIRNSKML